LVRPGRGSSSHADTSPSEAAGAVRIPDAAEELALEELALEAGSIGTWSWTAGADDVRRSTSFDRLFGLEPGTAQGSVRALLDRVHPDDRKEAAEALRGARDQTDLVVPPVRLAGVGSEPRWIEVRGGRVDPSDAESRWVGVCLDVTQHAGKTAGLARTLAQFRALTSHAPVGFAILDTNLRFVAVSDAYARMNGLDLERHLGRSPADVIPDIWPQIEPRIDAVIRSGEPVVDHEITGLTPALPGSQRTWVQSYYPVDDEEGRRLGAGLFALEITDRKRAERQARLVAGVSPLFGMSLPLSALLDRLARIALPEFADGAVIRVIDRPTAAGGVAVAHVDPGNERALRSFLLSFDFRDETAIPAAVALRRRHTARVRDITVEGAQLTTDEGVRRRLADLDVGSIISAPLMIAERILGVMTFFRSRGSGVQYQEDDEAIAEALTVRIARVLDNARVAEEGERARERLSGLADLGTVLAGELDSVARLEGVAAALVPTFADTCTVYLLDGSGSLEVSAFAHVDDDQAARVGDLRDWPKITSGSSSPVAEALRADAPVLLTRLPARPRARRDPDDARDLVYDMDVHSLLCVPLPGRGRPVGVLALGYVAPDRFYTADDIPVAFDIARRVGPAIANALRFEHEAGVAEILQRTLLPQRLPTLQSVDLAARYFPAGPGLSVGGDWYDALPVSDGRFLLAIGDVVGHGIRAATGMSRLRSVLQFCARTAGPAQILQQLDEHFAGTGESDMVTLLLIRFDPATGRVELASAGHPPPMVRDPDGSVRILEGGRGVPLCTVRNAVFRETEEHLAPGSMLLLYTDGLVERRRESLDRGLERLSEAMERAPDDVDAAIDAIAATMLSEAERNDDVALLGLRVRDPTELKLRLPARPRELASLRSTTRDWVLGRGGGRVDAEEVSLVVSEVATNAIEHAYRHEPREILVHGLERDEVLEISVRDFGRWRTPREDRGRGRGLALARALMDAVDVDPDAGGQGTEVRVRRRLRGPANAGHDRG
jgi:PAS domain S-box-containing protein